MKTNCDESIQSKRKRPKFSKFFKILIGLIVILGGGYYIMTLDFASGLRENVRSFFNEDIVGTEGEVTTITKSSLEEVFEISELQTADYIYNAIADVYDEDGETLKYHVAYEGTVTAGIDFSKVTIDIGEEEKKITIHVPDITIQDTVVNAGELDYIYEKDKYDNEGVYKEAYEACQKDLEKRVTSETELLDMARDNAKQVIEVLVSPWVEQIDSEYIVIVE